MSTLPPQALLGCIHTLWSWADLAYTEHIPAASLHQRRSLSPSGQHVGSRLTRRGLPVCMPAGDRWWHRQTSRNAAQPRLLGCLPSWVDVPLSDPDPSTYAASSIEPRNEPRTSAPRSASLTRSCLPARHSLYGWLLLSARFGRGHILPAGKYECQYEPHVGGGVRHMPCGTLLRGWLADQLRKVDLQPAGGSGYADGVQVVPPKLCDQGNRRRFGS